MKHEISGTISINLGFPICQQIGCEGCGYLYQVQTEFGPSRRCRLMDKLVDVDVGELVKLIGMQKKKPKDG